MSGATEIMGIWRSAPERIVPELVRVTDDADGPTRQHAVKSMRWPDATVARAAIARIQ